ncbi:MAG: hypothetical protein A4E65_03698 [Syntrophorhabdus sp. PtaU1.Bin153]|nr:MAG: hypothetical protein A4E65_03698 [Syntrophorhabdus sp. PtaU1.Bin153]
MQRINNDYVVVPMTFPTTDQTSTISSDILSMKNYRHADIVIQVGPIGKAAAVTLDKSAAVSAATVDCAFTRYLSTGFVLEYDGASVDTPAAAGETVTGAGGGVGYVYKDLGGKLICYAYNGTTFVDNEVLTFSGGKTAVANGIQKNEDIMVPRTAASNTFDLAAVANKQYVIPVDAADLGDGYDCVQVEIADCDTATHVAIFAILSEPRYAAEIPETAIYD